METYKLAIEGRQIELSSEDLKQLDCFSNKNILHVLEDGISYKAQLISIDDKCVHVKINNSTYKVEISDAVDQMVEQMGLNKVIAAVLTKVTAPMPGLILDILVEPGQNFEEGDALLILEAMKMENVIKATGSGQVKEILLEKGATVEKNQVIIEMV